jgi:hypothetical protein
MGENNNNLSTKNIDLASFLELSHVELLDIIALTPHLSRFVFESPPDSLLESWDSRQTIVNIRDFCDAREKLIREAREKQAALPRGGGR